MVFTRKSDQRGGEPAAAPSADPMSRPTPPPAPPRVSGAGSLQADSVIGSDLMIEGQGIIMRCRGSLRVNGSIQADVHSIELVVGENAQVNGAIAAEQVFVHGRVNGSIHGSRVILHQTAQVEGDIHSQTLAIEQGASFDGRSRKVNNPAEVAPQLNSPNAPVAAMGPPPIGGPPAMQPASHPVPLPRLHS